MPPPPPTPTLTPTPTTPTPTPPMPPAPMSERDYHESMQRQRAMELAVDLKRQGLGGDIIELAGRILAFLRATDGR